MLPPVRSTFANCWHDTTTTRYVPWRLTTPAPDASSNTTEYLPTARLAPMWRRSSAISTGASSSRSARPRLQRSQPRLLRQRKLPPLETATNPRGPQTTDRYVGGGVASGDSRRAASPLVAQIRLGHRRPIP